MKILISGHRQHKLDAYDEEWVRGAIERDLRGFILDDEPIIGLCGMADGVDLMFCEIVSNLAKIVKGRLLVGFNAYVPFEGQDAYMSEQDRERRKVLIGTAMQMIRAKNSKMVEDCDTGIIVWDGTKGGTHNVFQQMVECGKPFIWVDPQNERTTYVGP